MVGAMRMMLCLVLGTRGDKINFFLKNVVETCISFEDQIF